MIVHNRVDKSRRRLARESLIPGNPPIFFLNKDGNCSSPGTRISRPFSAPLEKFYMLSVEKIVTTIERILEY